MDMMAWIQASDDPTDKSGASAMMRKSNPMGKRAGLGLVRQPGLGQRLIVGWTEYQRPAVFKGTSVPESPDETSAKVRVP
jgi:hypothetical protein